LKKSKKIGLIILDGWGIGDCTNSDAIYKAEPPFFNSLMEAYPNSRLTTFGNAVGLPEGQMGNSEVGHINLGAGRVIWQMLEKINQAFKNNTVSKNRVFKESVAIAKNLNKPIHIIGLLSDGGVHSSFQHFENFISLIRENSSQPIFIHAILDGRDTDPRSGQIFLTKLLEINQKYQAQLSSVIGRYYAMDRDNRWERTAKAYHLFCNAEGEKHKDILDTINKYYKLGITDEFMPAIKLTNVDGHNLPNIEAGDVVYNINFRTDRPRQITSMLVEKDNRDYNTKKLDIHYVGLTNYDKTFKNTYSIFDEDNIINTLGEHLAKNGIGQLRAAETEKYPHVTFFFSGGREVPFDKEYRVLAASPKVATYDLQPSMSANELTALVLPYLEKDIGFMCLNFANADMVGHTGVYEAIIKAVLSVDQCLEKVISQGLKNDWEFIVLADHGNADFAINKDLSPNTQHSTNLVPCIYVGPKKINLTDGGLANIAPSILYLMGINAPKEMTAKSIMYE